MNQDQLKPFFRAQELSKRQQIREQLLRNYAELEEEKGPLNEIEQAAIRSLQRQNAAFRDLCVPHFPSREYWRRLWAAILGRPEEDYS